LAWPTPRVSELVRGDDLDLLGILDVVPGA
jgi:hypothetical protein